MTSTRWRGVLAALAAGLVLLTGCSAQPGPAPLPASPTDGSTTGSGEPPAPAHLVVVIFENRSEQQVLGSPAAPYLTSLAASGAQFADFRGVTHPSQPNYLALFSGSTQGVVDDSCPQDLGDRPNLAVQLDRAGYSFAGYSEGMPRVGYQGCADRAGGYARKHNPWVDFANVPATSNLPFTDFPVDLSRLPTVSFVVPNLCNGMHDCDVATGDRWARRHLTPYVTWARTHDSLLVVTFDEDDGTDANRIATFFVGPMVRAARLSQPVNHYNLLRTIEDLYELEPLGEARGVPALTGWY